LQEFYNICLKKQSGENYTWEDIYLLFKNKYNFKSGDHCRGTWKRYRKKNGILGVDKLTKVLVISDLHIPDHKENMILDTIKNNRNVDLIIINGDILDCKSVSSFYDEDISILDFEMIKAHELLAKIRSKTKAKIILVKGNHEERINRYYAKNAKILGTSVIETEILYKLSTGFTIKNKDKKKRTIYEPIINIEYSEGRSYIIGDLLINHPSTFKKDYMKTAYVMYNEMLKNKYPNVNVFIVSHTHQIGQIIVDNGKYLIESGCMCNIMSYADKEDKPYRFQQHGYIYLEMKNNKVNVNSIKINYLGHDSIVLN
jgi:predicted phosphodiesterase